MSISNGLHNMNGYALTLAVSFTLLLSPTSAFLTSTPHPFLTPLTTLHLSPLLHFNTILHASPEQPPTPTPPPPTPPTPPLTPLCDLQTFLKLTNQVQSGGEAKTKIQAGQCLLNDTVETRRAKKLFAGDVVELGGGDGGRLDVKSEVAKRGYVFRVKEKKVRPVARIIDGEKEFGGRFRSEEWRKERKEKKEGRKMQNKRDLLGDLE